MKSKLQSFALGTLLQLIFFHTPITYTVAQIPESLDAKVDMLGGSVEENDVSRKYFISLGPDVVPIVTKKLLQSLSEGSSPEAEKERIIMQMPLADQKRVRRQTGLIAMQGAALQNMELSSDVRQKALDALYQSLKSPYQHSRKSGIYAVTYGVGYDGIDQIIPLLNDPDLTNRVIASQMLAKIGDATTAKKIEKVLDQRRQGLTAEQVEKDPSFRHGYEAIKVLENSKVAIPSEAAIKTTMEAPKPATSIAAATPEAKPSTAFPVVPVAILAAVVLGIILYLFRRKSA